MLSCISNFRRRFAAYKALVTPLCLLAGFLVFGCSQPTGGGSDAPYTPPPPQTASYISMDSSGTVYELTVTEKTGARYAVKAGDSYTLIITKADGTKSTSSGTISNATTGTFKLKPSKGTAIFTVTVSGENLSKIEGTVTWDDSSTETVSQSSLTAIGIDIPADLQKNFQTEMTASLYQWTDGFEIANGVFCWYGDPAQESRLVGTIVATVPEHGDEPNLVIFKITEDVGHSYSPYTVGKYFAFAYKNLTPSAGVSMATPYKISTGKNSGVDTIGEAIVEYTNANDYYTLYGIYLPHTASAKTLGKLNGSWGVDVDGEDGFDDDYYIQIKGTALIEFLDDEGNGEYDSGSDDMIAELGDIVEHTDASQTSGVLYVKVLGSDLSFNNGKFIAIAWKNLTATTVAFMTAGDEYDTLAAVKTAKNDPANNSHFTQAGFYASYRQ